MSAEFCDTNIIVYARDLSAGEKRVQARQLLDRLWASGDGAISVQVLQELFNTLTQKLSVPFYEARTIVSSYSGWQIFEPTSREVLDAIDYSGRWNISFLGCYDPGSCS